VHIAGRGSEGQSPHVLLQHHPIRQLIGVVAAPWEVLRLSPQHMPVHPDSGPLITNPARSERTLAFITRPTARLAAFSRAEPDLIQVSRSS